MFGVFRFLNLTHLTRAARMRCVYNIWWIAPLLLITVWRMNRQHITPARHPVPSTLYSMHTTYTLRQNVEQQSNDRAFQNASSSSSSNGMHWIMTCNIRYTYCVCLFDPISRVFDAEFSFNHYQMLFRRIAPALSIPPRHMRTNMFFSLRIST